MSQRAYKTVVKIAEQDGIIYGIAELMNGIGDILNVVERAYLDKETTDAFIIRDLNERVGHGVLIWGDDDELESEHRITASDCLTPHEQNEFQHDAPYGEFAYQGNELGQSLVSIARAVDLQDAFDTGADISDGLTDGEK